MVKLFSKNSNLCDHNSPTLQTDRQTDRQIDTRTDRQTTCDRNTALCTKVHRAVKMVAWLSGSALVSINVVTLRPARLILEWVTVCAGKPSWYNQPPRSTEPFILPGSTNEYRQYAGGKGVRITSVGWQVTLCDPI